MLCRGADVGLEAFANFDYVGAPFRPVRLAREEGARKDETGLGGNRANHVGFLMMA